MDIREYLQIIWKRKCVIFLCVALAIAGGFIVNYMILTPVYLARSRVYLSGRNIDFEKQAQLIQSPEVVRRVDELSGGEGHHRRAPRKGFDLNRIPGVDTAGPRKGVLVEPDPERDLIAIYIESLDPEEGAARANAYARAYESELLNAAPESIRPVLRANNSVARDAVRISESASVLSSEGGVGRGQSLRLGELATLANSLGHMAQIQETYLMQESGPSHPGIAFVESAPSPIEPIRPRRERNIALCVIIGLLLGIGIAFGLESRSIRKEKSASRPGQEDPKHMWVARVFLAIANHYAGNIRLYLGMLLKAPIAVWKRKLMVLGFVAVFGALGYWINYQVLENVYEASARVEIRSSDGEPVDNQKLIGLLKNHITGKRAARRFFQDQHKTGRDALDDEQLFRQGLVMADRLSVDDSRKAGQVRILMLDYRPEQAMAYANAYARGFADVIQDMAPTSNEKRTAEKQRILNELERRQSLAHGETEYSENESRGRRLLLEEQKSIAELQNLAGRFEIADLDPGRLSYLQISHIAHASLPRKPVSPKRSRNVKYALLIGLLFGIGAASLLYEMEDTAQTD